MPIASDYEERLLATLDRLNQRLNPQPVQRQTEKPAPRHGATAYPVSMEAPTRYMVGNSPTTEQDYVFARNYGLGNTPTAISGLSPQELASKQRREAEVEQFKAESFRRAQLQPILQRLLQHRSVMQARGEDAGLLGLLTGRRAKPITIPGVETIKPASRGPSNLLNLLGRFNR